jgi:hypothetical protein
MPGSSGGEHTAKYRCAKEKRIGHGFAEGKECWTGATIVDGIRAADSDVQ